MKKYFLCLLAVLGLTLSGQASAALTKEEIAEASNQCKTLFNNEQYADAYPFCQKACDNNDSSSCQWLGGYYWVNQDFQRAKQQFQKACDLNDGGSCYNLGLLYFAGKGVEQDYEQSNQYYKKPVT